MATLSLGIIPLDILEVRKFAIWPRYTTKIYQTNANLLYCIVLYCILLCCTVLYRTVLFFSVAIV